MISKCLALQTTLMLMLFIAEAMEDAEGATGRRIHNGTEHIPGYAEEGSAERKRTNAASQSKLRVWRSVWRYVDTNIVQKKTVCA